jgi:nicotinate-nucleotide adenylyltransferase
MLSASLAGLSAYRVETIEADLPSPSYTAETLAALRARDPSTDFHLILGADSLIDLPYWYEPQRVLAQAGLIVVPRPGVELWTAERLASSLHLPSSAVRMQTVPCPLMDVASRDLRRRVADGRSIRFMVPREVETIIRQRGLYV